jgi:quinone-modifying oxidoreductase subunit QmoC
MKAADQAAGRYAPTQGIAPSLINTLKVIFTHGKFSKCAGHESRRWAHLGAFYGFAALFIVSAWAVVALYMINPLIPGHDHDLLYPFLIWNPWKILANVGCIALIGGCLIAIRDRLTNEEEAGKSSSFDWIFVGLLLTVGVTGLLTELMRFVAEPADAAAVEFLAYTIYFVHLVAVFHLLVYLPYSKFAHVLYRTAALVYAEHTGRGARKSEQKKEEASEENAEQAA